MNETETGQYWDEVESAFCATGSDGLWRSHSDRVNAALLDEWLGGRQFPELLKTDLFDEAVTDGIYPCLQRHAGKVLGIDLSPRCVAAAKDRHVDLETRCADVRELPFEDGRFGCVVSISTLDHFRKQEDIHTSLSELFRVLSPGGTLAVSFDNLLNPFIALRNALPFSLLEKLGLVPYFVGKTVGMKGLVASLEQAGFDVVETRAIMHCPRVLAVPLARRRQEIANVEEQRRFLDSLSKFERMSAWPTARVSGHFVAALALKP